MSHMTLVPASHIALDEHGDAWIVGANTRVIDVVMDRVAYGWDAEEINRQHPHIPLAQVHAALAYYYDHKAELDAELERQSKQFDAERAAAGVSPLGRLWRERKQA